MFRFLGRAAERAINKVVIKPPYAVPLEAFILHQSLFVVDLHADSLLWSRNLLTRSRTGHVDLPRLLSGNVGLQVFGVVTSSPLRENFYRNSTRGDRITALSIAGGWPLRTWGNLLQRALFQARKLERLSAQSGGKLILVRTTADLDELQARRARNEAVVGGFPALEGAHALLKRVENVDRLYQAGFRMIGLTHFTDNRAAGSAHGRAKGGLTDFGRDLVRRVQAGHMLLDLAHASPRAIDDVLEIATRPVVVSHTGVCGVHDHPRNLSDEHIRRIAAAGGVIGIGLFEGALPAPSLALAVRSMRHIAALVGVDAVALGSDFDGGVTAPVDASGLALLTEALLAEGFDPDEIARIMGGNAVRVIRAALPREW